MISITSEEVLKNFIKQSQHKNIFILKHSTRCSTSVRALQEFKYFSNKHPEVECAYIDLLSFRSVSDKLTEIAQVTHQSPQVLQFYHEKCIWHTSHSGVNAVALIQRCQPKKNI